MWHDKEELLFDLLTREALLIREGEVHRLEGPYYSKAHAVAAAEEFKQRLLDMRLDLAA